MNTLSQMLSQLVAHPLFLPALIVCLLVLAGGIAVVWARLGSGAPRLPEQDGAQSKPKGP